jgi:mono/diheme cytochrome c family protein
MDDMSLNRVAVVAILLAQACASEPPVETAPDVNAAQLALTERGRYLAMHAAVCSNCHTPKTVAGEPDHGRELSGVDCYIDVVPQDPNAGCLSTANLTNHETGLKNRSDREIADLITKGVRPDGKALHPFMPYPYFANLHDEDVKAIIAYLRTVPGVERTAAPSQPPFIAPPQPAPAMDAASFPMPRGEYPQRDAALRGRYLATSVSVCVSCHTPRENGQLALDKAFQGGLSFKREAGLPSSYPEVVYSSNITPHPTGIAGYTVDQLVRVLKRGVDRHDRGICAPMPAGPKEPYGGLHDRDARDIAHYLLSLAPHESIVPNGCETEPPGEKHARR